MWPGVLERLRASNVTNYSIYRYGEMLFSYMDYNGSDLEEDMRAMAEDPLTRYWWEVCNPLQRPVSDRAEGEWWHQLQEVFHLR
jgi:L-rhamnose mutarotase